MGGMDEEPVGSGSLFNKVKPRELCWGISVIILATVYYKCIM
jgi:hypothetical protein